jgi:hypothetical protein
LQGVTVELGYVAGVSPNFGGGAPVMVRVVTTPEQTGLSGSFRILAQTTTDANGKYRFPGLARRSQFMLRTSPPARASYARTYFPEFFYLGMAREREINLVLLTR